MQAQEAASPKSPSQPCAQPWNIKPDRPALSSLRHLSTPGYPAQHPQVVVSRPSLAHNTGQVNREMAEVAGLVIGGAGLAALFDSCLNAFEYVESGSKYGREYNKAALKISLLQLRLQRWKTTVAFVEDETSSSHPGALIASPADAEKVRDLLAHIEDDFEEAERRARKYQFKESPVVANLERTDTTIAALTRRVQGLAVARQRAASVRQKASWALRDQLKFQQLIQSQTAYIDSLLELFPATAPAAAMEIRQKQQARAADSEATTLAEPVEPGESAAETLEVLREAARGVDPVMEQAAERARTMVAEHRFGGTVTMSGGARMAEGDYVHNDYRGPFRREGDSFTATITIQDQAIATRGTNYGGRHPFD